MTDSPSSHLVLASQRSGSTLLVESLRATGVAGEPQEFFQYLPTTSQAPQPLEWFSDVEDESIVRLLDPLDAGTPDLAPAEIWRNYVRTVGRTFPAALRGHACHHECGVVGSHESVRTAGQPWWPG